MKCPEVENSGRLGSSSPGEVGVSVPDNTGLVVLGA